MHAVIDASDNRFPRFWEELVASDPSHNPFYAPAQRARQAGSGFRDHSFMVLSGSGPVVGCSLTSSIDASGRRRLGFLGREASTLVNRRQLHEPSNNLQPEVVYLLQDHFSRLITAVSPDYLDYFDPVSCGLMSPLTQVLLERGARPEIHQSQSIRLTLSERALQRGLQPDYRQVITKSGSKPLLTVQTGAGLDPGVQGLQQRCEHYFADLGASSECWSNCLDLIHQGQGFVIRAVGAENSSIQALFLHNGHTSHYILHDGLLEPSSCETLLQVLWRGVLFSKSIGCALLDLGGLGLTEAGINPAGFGGTAQTRLKVSLQPD